MPTDSVPVRSAPVLLAASAWLALALLAGRLRLLAVLPPPFPQMVLVGLTVALLVLFCAWPTLRAWGRAVDVRVLVLVHVTRFVGIYFLVLHGRGELPWAFAVPGGWGDIAVAAAALLVALLVSPATAAGRRVYVAWNAAGLLDILLVAGTAARLAFADPASMQALTGLPLSLLPTFLVPIIVATHVVIGWRLR